MARLFRHEAPELHDHRVLRTGVQRTLSERFERQVTTLIAGAGFGKTTALVQAFEENRLAPLGVDRWLACEPADEDAHHLAHGLATSLGISAVDPTANLLDRVVEACAACAPLEVCITLDDVHLVPAASTGTALLGEFVSRLPANAHVLLSGRTRPAIHLTRLELTGQCASIRESDLSLSAADIAQLAQLTGVEVDGDGTLPDLGGWPALVALALQQGQPGQFVWEEVLDLLHPDQQTLLHALVAIEEADADLLGAITGINDQPALASIPLIHRRGDRYRAHDLWHELLADPQSVIGPQRAAARFLLDAERFDEAVALCLRVHDRGSTALNDAFAEAVRGRLVGDVAPEVPELRDWAARLDPTLAETPLGLLLAGFIQRLDSPLGAECDALLSRAADGFIEADDGAGAVAALGALAFARTIRRDSAAMIETLGRLDELANTGVGAATPYQRMSDVLLATFAEDFPAVRDLTTQMLALRLSRELRGVTLMMRANALNKLGHDALPTATEGLGLGLDLPGVRAIALAASWQVGELEIFLDEPVELTQGSRDSYVAGIWFTCVAAAIGDDETAVRLLADIEAQPNEAGSAIQPESLWLAQAAVALLQQRHDDARAAALRVIDRFPLTGRAAAAYVRSMALLYRLLPEHRAYFDDQPELGPLYHRDIRLNQAWVAAVEHDDRAAAQRVQFPVQTSELLPALGARSASELLAAAWEHRHPDVADHVSELLELLGEHGRDAFRAATEHTNPSVAKGAKAILESMPLAPGTSVELRLFGGTDLAIDGDFVTSADWRRERVRALLTFLVLHGDTTRENVMAALWPAAEPAAARRSLRSTLNVLNSVLEPGRTAGEAPYFVRSTGQRLRLFQDEQLRIDALDFERLLGEAAALADAGTPSLSVEPLRSAVGLYRGDLLADSYDDWAVFARDRLRSRYVAAAVRCAELLVATNRADEAIDVITPVLGVEPWSEAAHRSLIAAHLERDDVAAARRSMATCHTALDDFGGPSEEATLMLERRLVQR